MEEVEQELPELQYPNPIVNPEIEKMFEYRYLGWNGIKYFEDINAVLVIDDEGYLTFFDAD